jgi:hypothetical protein
MKIKYLQITKNIKSKGALPASFAVALVDLHFQSRFWRAGR